MKKIALVFFPALLFCLWANTGAAQKITAVDISGAITPVQAEILQKSIAQAENEKASFLLIRLDTPGGTLSSARKMVKEIINSAVPVGVWVGPSGARAASAGVFLVAASDVAAMAPKTTIGSASPVKASGKDTGKTMRKKITNELSSLLRSLGKDKKRNTQWYEKSVSQSANLNAQEAVLKNVVEYVAVSETDFLEQLGNAGIIIGKDKPFSPEDLEISRYEPSYKQSILSWLVSPQIAYLLFLAGILGFFFELSSPGAVFPGVFGAICLILALYAFSALPTSAAGILLLLAGFVFFLLELKIASFGLLGLAASASIFMGSIMLFDPGVSGLKIPLQTVIPAVLTVVVFFLAIIYLVGKTQISGWKQEKKIIGMTGRIIDWEKGQGKIKLRGEIWNCRGAEPGREFSPGDAARVENACGLMLEVKPTEEHSGSGQK